MSKLPETVTDPIVTEPPPRDSVHPVLLGLISKDLLYIEATSQNLKKYQDGVGTRLTKAQTMLKSLKDGFNLHIDDTKSKIRKFEKHIRKIKLPIPSQAAVDFRELDDLLRHDLSESTRAGNDQTRDPDMYREEIFEKNLVFDVVEAVYNDLEVEAKLCFLCFSVFPENVVITKRLMVYWWIAEGFVVPNPEEGTTAEEVGTKYFRKLIEKGLLKPINEKCGAFVSGKCTMHPEIRTVVITLAKRALFFDFDENGDPTAAYSLSTRACLVGQGLLDTGNLKSLHMLFNLNESLLELKPEWMAHMKNANLLYLGRWQVSPEHHIEVEDTKFLHELKHMKHLRYLSLQGMSRIDELPDGSLLKLENLIILDMRACHNLEKVPKEVGFLKSLTHLDMSECYLLDHMPKEVSFLTNLQVFKGFVISDVESSCSLEDLAKNLRKLRKLGIYSSVKEFPRKDDLMAFSQFSLLTKLRMEWGGGGQESSSSSRGKSQLDDQDNIQKENKARKIARTLTRSPTLVSLAQSLNIIQACSSPPPSSSLPKNLVKLHLECYPGKFAPSWLKSSDLDGLKKLYIRGGGLRDLSSGFDWNNDMEEDRWKVEILRVKYMDELKMNWRKLRDLFPELLYLEMVECPKLTLFPCNEDGTWINRNPEKLTDIHVM